MIELAFGVGIVLGFCSVLFIDWRVDKRIQRKLMEKNELFQNAVIGLHKEHLKELMDTEIPN